MRRIAIASVLVLGLMSAAGADEPALGPAFAEGLERGLSSPDPAARSKAESALARATPDALRALVLRLRDRLALPRADSRDVRLAPSIFVPAEPPDLPPPASAEGPLVEVEVSVLDAPRDGAERWRDASHPAWRFVEATHAKRLLDWAGSVGAVASRPRILAVDGQRATIEIGEARSYVKDFDVEISMGGPLVADPVVDQVFVGFGFDVTPHVARGRVESVELRWRTRELLTLSEVPVPVAGTATPVRIQVPETLERTWSSWLFPPAGSSVLLFPPRDESRADGRARMVLVSARVVEAPPAAK